MLFAHRSHIQSLDPDVVPIWVSENYALQLGQIATLSVLVYDICMWIIIWLRRPTAYNLLVITMDKEASPAFLVLSTMIICLFIQVKYFWVWLIYMTHFLLKMTSVQHKLEERTLQCREYRILFGASYFIYLNPFSESCTQQRYIGLFDIIGSLFRKHSPLM